MKTINNERGEKRNKGREKEKIQTFEDKLFYTLCKALIGDFHFDFVNSNTSRTQTESRTD